MCFVCHSLKLSRKQIYRYTAKLQLLDYGLVHAANTLDDFVAQPAGSDKKAKGKGKKSSAGAEGSDGEAAADGAAFVTPAQYKLQVDAYVAHRLAQHPDARQNDFKIGIVYDARRKLIAELLKAVVARPICHTCGALVCL